MNEGTTLSANNVVPQKGSHPDGPSLTQQQAVVRMAVNPAPFGSSSNMQLTFLQVKTTMTTTRLNIYLRVTKTCHEAKMRSKLPAGKTSI